MTLLEDVLERTGAEVHPHTTKPNEVMVNCPFCVERDYSEDKKFRLGINTAYGWAHCYHCDFRCRGLRRLLGELCRVYEITYSFRSRQIIEEKIVEEVSPETLQIEPCELPLEYEQFRATKESISKKARKYLQSRGVTTLQLINHKIGFCAVGKYSYRIILPVLGKNKKVYGFVSRSFADMEPKYLNSPGLKLLWTSQRFGSMAVEVEGIFDALAIERAVTHLPGVVAVSPLGSSITATQLEQLVDYSALVLVPDRDLAGVRGCITRAKLYAEYGLCPKICIPDQLDGRDPGDMDREEILNTIQNAKAWNKNTELRLRALRE